MFDVYTWSVLVFVLILAAYVYRSRAKFKRESGIFLLRRTERGKKFLEQLGRRWPRFWKVVGGLGVAAGFYFSLEISWLLLGLTYRNLTAGAVQGLTFLIPSPSSSATVVPGVLLVPFWYWIITIALLVVVHEGMHGILTARERVRIKSLGTGLLAVIPLAFVEPDEKQLQKKGFWAQQRVFAAGSFANFLLAFIAVGLLVAISPMGQGLYTASGVQFSQAVPGLPAAGANLSGTITSIGGNSIVNVSDLTRVLELTGIEKETSITVLQGNETKTYTLVTGRQPQLNFTPNLDQTILLGLGQAELVEQGIGTAGGWMGLEQKKAFWRAVGKDPRWAVTAAFRIAELETAQMAFREPGYLGILGAGTVKDVRTGAEAAAGAFEFIAGLLFFLFIINLGVGQFNLLPLKPLDGGRMWELVFRKVSTRYAKQITMAVGLLMFLLIAAGFVLPFAR